MTAGDNSYGDFATEKLLAQSASEALDQFLDVVKGEIEIDNKVIRVEAILGSAETQVIHKDNS